MALLSGRELELLAELDIDDLLGDEGDKNGEGVGFGREFLKEVQEAADRHLLEKNEIRDAVGLLKLYHQAAGGTVGPKHVSTMSSRVINCFGKKS